MDRRSKFVWIMLAVVLVLIGAVAVFIVPLLGQETGPVDLRLRLEPGKSYAFSLQHSTESSLEIDGERMKSSDSLVLDYTFDVREVDEQGNAKISVTCDRVGDPAERSEVQKAKADMYDQSFWRTLSPRGRVLALEPVGEPYDQLLTRGMGAQIVKALIQGSLAIYPEGPVQPGSRWQGEPLGEAVDGAVPRRSLQLKRRRKGIAIVTLRFEVAGTSLDNSGDQEMKVDVSSSVKGTVKIDEATGCIVRGETTEKFSSAFGVQGERTVVSRKVWQKVTLVEK